MTRWVRFLLTGAVGAAVWLPAGAIRSHGEAVVLEVEGDEELPGDPPGVAVRDYLRDWDRGAGSLCWERMDADSRRDLEALGRPTGRSGTEVAYMLSVIAAGRRAVRPGDDPRRIVAVEHDGFRTAAVTLESPGGRRATVRVSHDGAGWRVPVWVAGVVRDRRAVGPEFLVP